MPLGFFCLFNLFLSPILKLRSLFLPSPPRARAPQSGGVPWSASRQARGAGPPVGFLGSRVLLTRACPAQPSKANPGAAPGAAPRARAVCPAAREPPHACRGEGRFRAAFMAEPPGWEAAPGAGALAQSPRRLRPAGEVSAPGCLGHRPCAGPRKHLWAAASAVRGAADGPPSERRARAVQKWPPTDPSLRRGRAPLPEAPPGGSLCGLAGQAGGSHPGASVSEDGRLI